jgi:transcriptional activator SPT8
LKLNSDQNKFLSGSWDKTINHFDLNSGQAVQTFRESTGQISSIEYRPIGGIEVEQIQQNVNTSNEDEEDDMDSLFGDEEEPESRTENTSVDKQAGKPAPIGLNQLDSNVFLSSSIDGSINIWDLRTNSQVIKFKSPKGTPPWCVSACWSQDGDFIYAGRRNSTVEEFSLKMPFDSSGDSKTSKLLRFPHVSGPVTVVKSLPNNNHLLCASYDNIRIYDLRLYETQKKTPFLIVPGHHGGVISDIQFDPTYRYMISASGNRGWQGTSTETVFIYDIGLE